MAANKMADWTLPRKSRKSNFSTDEVDALLDSVKAHYEILYGKFSSRVTNRWLRQKAWLDILENVNGVSAEKRTLQEVKNKWKKCQYAMKERGQLFDLDDDGDDSPFEDLDSMPIQERLSKGSSGSQQLKSLPLSPTKLKVTRHTTKTIKHQEPPPSPVNEEMCLRWNSHHSNMQTAFPNILSKEQYVDVTLAAEGKTLKCHRLILSSCSPYFEEVLSGISPFQHPVIFMRDIPFCILKSLCDFMYAGEVHIFQDKLEELLTVAEVLKIKGLAGKSTPPESPETKNDNNNKEKKREKTTPSTMPPTMAVKKNNEKFDDDLLDPLELLEPLYEESAEEKKPSTNFLRLKDSKYNYQAAAMRRPLTRRLRKRKLSDQKERDTSPPQVFTFRKGTRSRPNVKIPKYFHNDFNSTQKILPVLPSASDPLIDVSEIKTEPIDVEDNLVDYNYNSGGETSFIEGPNNKDVDCLIAPPRRESSLSTVLAEAADGDVTTVMSGGLEVIKITLGEEVPKEQDPLDGGMIITEALPPAIEEAPPSNDNLTISLVPTDPEPLEVPMAEIRIENVRTSSLEEQQQEEEEEENPLAETNEEKEDKTEEVDETVNEIDMDGQSKPPDIEEEL